MNAEHFNLIPPPERVIPEYDANDRPGLILTDRARLLVQAPAVTDAEYAQREAQTIAAYAAACRIVLEEIRS